MKLSRQFFLNNISILLLLCSLSACKVDIFLQKEQYVIKSNTIKIENVKNRRDKAALILELPTLYKQRDLNVFFFGKYTVGAYHYFKYQTDSTWLQKQLRSRIISIYEPKATEATEKNMRQYLQNIGYLYPSVNSIKNNHNRDKGFIDITYFVNPGRRYIIDTIQFVCADTAVEYILKDMAPTSSLRRGYPLDLRLYEQERQRITDTLNNFGYARFTPNYILPLDCDTTEVRYDANGNRLINAVLTVQTPNGRKTHPRFITGQVQVFPNYDARKGEQFDSITTIGFQEIYTEDGQLGIKKDPLSKSIPIVPYSTYRKENADKAFRLLTNLGVFRSINIKPLIDECDSNAILYKVYLSPNDKRSIEFGAEINYSNIASVAVSGDTNGSTSSKLGRIGVAVDFGLTNRNAFGGAERFSWTNSFGLDYGLQRTTQNGLTSDIRSDMALSIPKFVNPSKHWKLYSQVGLIRKNFYSELLENATSDITLNYNYSDRLSLKLFRLQQFNLGWRYVLRRKGGSERYVLNQTAVELQLSKVNEDFKNRLLANNNQRFLNSLQDQFMTGLLFRSLFFERNGKVNSYGERVQISTNLEQSGSELWAFEQIFNKKQAFSIGNLPFSKYWRTEVDIRYSREFAPKRALGARLSAGLAVPFGTQPVPYSRQFFVGGPNSIRGWIARNLGPGSKENTTSTIPFQAGDIKLEFNSEYRFPIFWRLESAVFLDFGNVWNINSDVEAENFGKFFYDQIGISSGLGLRLDVTYAYIRVDFGFRLRNPYTSADAPNRWIPVDKWSWSNNLNPNFALGLPF